MIAQRMDVQEITDIDVFQAELVYVPAMVMGTFTRRIVINLRGENGILVFSY